MRVRIQNDSGLGYMTKITNVETGQELEYVTDVSIELNPNRATQAVLTLIVPAIDIIADAEIKKICPCCGKSMEASE
jgi:hypothetical protein